MEISAWRWNEPAKYQRVQCKKKQQQLQQIPQIRFIGPDMSFLDKNTVWWVVRSYKGNRLLSRRFLQENEKCHK